MGFPNTRSPTASGGAYYRRHRRPHRRLVCHPSLADAKFHTLTGNLADVANATEGSAPVIPAGTVLYGKFTALDLHSGRVIAYTA